MVSLKALFLVIVKPGLPSVKSSWHYLVHYQVSYIHMAHVAPHYFLNADRTALTNSEKSLLRLSLPTRSGRLATLGRHRVTVGITEKDSF